MNPEGQPFLPGSSEPPGASFPAQKERQQDERAFLMRTPSFPTVVHLLGGVGTVPTVTPLQGGKQGDQGLPA